MTVAANAGRPARTDSIFFPSMAVALALTVFVGFSRSFYLRPAFHGGPPVLSTLMIAHGIAFTCWVAVLITQTGLVASNRRDLHRKLGVLGVGIACAMLLLGEWLAIDALRRGSAPAGAPSPQFFFAIPTFVMVAFAILTGLGILNRSRPAWHKRFMILGTAAITAAAISRWPFELFANGGPPVFFAGSDLFIVAVALYDFATLRRVHPATLWSAAVIFGYQATALAIGGTALWTGFANWIAA